MKYFSISILDAKAVIEASTVYQSFPAGTTTTLCLFADGSRAWELNQSFACDVSLGYKSLCWVGNWNFLVT